VCGRECSKIPKAKITPRVLCLCCAHNPPSGKVPGRLYAMCFEKPNERERANCCKKPRKVKRAIAPKKPMPGERARRCEKPIKTKRAIVRKKPNGEKRATYS